MAGAQLKTIARGRDPNQTELLQAEDKVLESLDAVFARDPKNAKVMEKYLEPVQVNDAPADSAIDLYRCQLDTDVVKYHIIEGNQSADSIADLRTMKGEFCQTFVDDAIVGQVD
eukprot:CAMPEP_0113949100 /NCGR_PEP_ID=MMETSP1339-20121228/73850_1 /TAXON_ID=94617 /ORGANISM="Fibrocapsa japonica" /LENGTH=113 /DNA_ID=CAMNT_0000956427 /DNA_START=190 /DNA_END=529 /DNA_ORIENTATION=- /assembly_acc=CAM_ASM_000762